MIQSKLGLKILGLCSLVLGLMAVVTASAQAEAGAAWMVNGSNITAELKPKVKAVLENETASLLTTILGIPTKVLCKALEVTNALGVEGSVGEGKVKFTSCATFLKGSETASAPCLPKTAGVNDVIESNAGTGLLKLEKSKNAKGEEVVLKVTLLKALPNKEGKELPLGVIESSEECAVGQKINVTGELFLKDCENKLETELVTHLVEVDNSLGNLRASGQPATIDGSANVTLVIPHLNAPWSGLVK